MIETDPSAWQLIAILLAAVYIFGCGYCTRFVQEILRECKRDKEWVPAGLPTLSVLGWPAILGIATYQWFKGWWDR